MRIIITENKLKSLITKMIGYDLSDRVEMITSWWELCYGGKMAFQNDEKMFNKFLNHFGPVFMFSVGNGQYHDRYYVQYQGKENGWLIRGESVNSTLDEYEFLSLLGIDSLGLEMNNIIDEFVEE